MSRRVTAELTKILAFYPSAKVTEETVLAYAEYLADLPEELVLAAITECAKTCTFYPSLAEIRQRATEIAGDGALVDAETAWGEVQREIRRVGVSAVPALVGWDKQGEPILETPQPQFSSPFIAAAVEAMGWDYLCTFDHTKEPESTVRAQFRDMLKVAQRRATDRVVSGRGPIGPALGSGNGTGDLTAIGDAVTLERGDDQ